MKLLILFLLSLSAWASQALTTAAALSIRGTIPNTGTYSAVGSFRIEGHLNGWTTQSAHNGVFEKDSDWKLWISSDNYLVWTGPGASDQISILITGLSKFRFVAQRRCADEITCPSGTLTLEIWNELTGAYSSTSMTLTSTGLKDMRNATISIGKFYEANSPTAEFGAIRWFASQRALASTPPARHITSSYGDLADFEFEGNLTDSSANAISMSVLGGSAAYSTVSAINPAVTLASTNPTTKKAGASVTLDCSASFANNDNPTLTVAWSQNSGPDSGTFGSPSATVTSFNNGSVFGTYSLRVTATDASANATQSDFKLGSVRTDSQDRVVFSNANYERLLGKLIRWGANPWTWNDISAKYAADQVIAILDSTNGNGFYDYFNQAAANGTISVQYNNNVVTGTSTQFQTDFCGGPGNTTPSASTNRIYIWYPHPDYPTSPAYPSNPTTQKGRGGFWVKECTSQTSLKLARESGADLVFSQAGTGSDTFSGLKYAISSNVKDTGYLFTNIPANYYDNVLALYALYFRSGIDTYRDAARTLASRFFSGPNWDSGTNWWYFNAGTTNDSGKGAANFTVAGPARGAAVAGLILWGMEDGSVDVWPGVSHLFDNWIYYSGAYQIAAGGIGDIREGAYMLGGLGLCSLFNTNLSYRDTYCKNGLQNSINNLWAVYRCSTPGVCDTTENTWVAPATQSPSYAAANGTIYVTTTNGSPNITLSGSTWAASDFLNDGNPKCLWFVDDKTNVTLGGASTNAIGDTTCYYIQSVNSTTTATLTANYAGSTGQKALYPSIFGGMGAQTWMLGILYRQMAQFVHPALVARGLTSEAATVLTWVGEGLDWLGTNALHADTGKGIYNARRFINCEPTPGNDVYCAQERAPAGELAGAYPAVYAIAPTPTRYAKGNQIYQGLWARPSYAAPETPNGYYLCDRDQVVINTVGMNSCTTGLAGYMFATPQPIMNKWLGYFDGVGASGSWPAERLGASLGSTTVLRNGSLRGGVLR